MDNPAKTAPHRQEDDASDSLLHKGPGRGETPSIKGGCGQPPRRPSSGEAIQQCLLDSLLAIPAACFIFYAFAVLVSNGIPIDQHPVPALQVAARYSPTVFPITFSAIAANLLKAAAAWKLERGITILSLEYLLKCRTVFSAVTTPLSLRAINTVILFLILFWALSPLGGQAALRVMDTVPSTAAEPWPFQYLEFISPFRHAGPGSSAGYTEMPSIQATFTAALAMPNNSKESPQDLFGNIKIPMVEYYQQSDRTSDDDGWYTVDLGSDTHLAWSSLIGLPVTSLGGLSTGSNYSFYMNTSYMSANCSMKHSFMDYPDWTAYRNTSDFENERTLAFRTPKWPTQWDTEPFEISLTSWFSPSEIVTNATCTLNQVYAEVDVKCQGPTCTPDRIRRIPNTINGTVRTVLHQISPEGHKYQGVAIVFSPYMQTFVKAGLSLYDLQESSQVKLFASAIETYITDPATPYTSRGIGSQDGTNMSSIGGLVFSQRFSQLLNTFWLSSVASRNVTGHFNFGDKYDLDLFQVVAQNATGTRTPNQLVMQVNWAWLFILLLASIVMLASGIVAAVLGCLRQGPDVLDHSAMFFRDNPYVNVAPCHSGSMENASDQVRRVRGMRVCIGDVDHTGEAGRLAFATVDGAIPLSSQKAGRLYV